MIKLSVCFDKKYMFLKKLHIYMQLFLFLWCFMKGNSFSNQKKVMI